MIDFLPGIVLAEGRLGALAREIGEGSYYIPRITGLRTTWFGLLRAAERPQCGATELGIKPAARSSWVKSQGARPNVAGANNATPLIPGPRRIAHSPNEKPRSNLILTDSNVGCEFRPCVRAHRVSRGSPEKM